MFDITLKMVQRNAFNVRAIENAISREEKRRLVRIGAFVRTVARRSLRRRKRVSKPGRPPSVHARGFASLKSIFFVFNPRQSSVVIGPVKLSVDSLTKNPISVPQTLEFGGGITVTEQHIGGGDWRTVSKRSQIRKKFNDPRRKPRKGPKRKGPKRPKTNAEPGALRRRSAKVDPRPFMGPALETAVQSGKIADAFAGMVGG
ncbi:MAG: hypothetical protein AAFX06_33785 [Planctomycetota bacterium]